MNKILANDNNYRNILVTDLLAVRDFHSHLIRGSESKWGNHSPHEAISQPACRLGFCVWSMSECDSMWPHYGWWWPIMADDGRWWPMMIGDGCLAAYLECQFGYFAGLTNLTAKTERSSARKMTPEGIAPAYQSLPPQSSLQALGSGCCCSSCKNFSRHWAGQGGAGHGGRLDAVSHRAWYDVEYAFSTKRNLKAGHRKTLIWACTLPVTLRVNLKCKVN